VITIHQRYRQTDRQTTCDRNTALCTKVHRAVKMRLQRTDDGQSIPADLEWSVYLSYAYILDISGGWARLGHTDNWRSRRE